MPLRELLPHSNSHILLFLFSGPPADHWALVSGLPTYVAENGFVSLSQELQGNQKEKGCGKKTKKTRLVK